MMLALSVRFTCHDQAAAEAYEAAPHTRRYLAERSAYLAATEVDWLTLQTGTGTVG
jgi:hypothetical protein